MQPVLRIVGGGLAGSEAAWQAAERGIHVQLYEMRPAKQTEAHHTEFLGELVCSNSLGSKLKSNGTGLLYQEMELLNSIICRVADRTCVPAGAALAVDRQLFARELTNTLSNHPNIEIIRQEISVIPSGLTIIATGPLTSSSLAKSLQAFHGESNLFFFDAIAPLIAEDSIDHSLTFRGSRYGKGNSPNGDYLNCPMTREQYYRFVEELVKAKQIPLKSFEGEIQTGVDAGPGHFFEGCLPVEEIARRGLNALAFGPLRPVGLRKMVEGTPPYAVVQLRQDNLHNTIYNMVGFQTNLIFPEQQRIFRLIPGLEKAEFVHYGQMHRNTFLFAPTLINQRLQARNRKDLFFAGQLIGIEGYLGNAASGLVAGINAARFLHNEQLVEFPTSTMVGALCHYVSHADRDFFQPMKANFGILAPIIPKIREKQERKAALAERSINEMKMFKGLL
ncbi:MAG TPA: methylenetetrahydrofolate--tRNA-(uracil(54)-C(5))-methyltransferase (FADH(2)-oxidizing) TrmFO [Anaerolineaceae bacterium]|nr:methylenetetrahydrofolate--tRNA-(uracil(54)-C(5))-methyltransferase (FADH(2)-oxidizing) TrmFO [Anaerolineaceae bacterium]